MNQPFQTPSLLCDPFRHLSRRTLLGAGAGGSLMSYLASQLAHCDEVGITDPARPKSVILLWMQGAPSQLETFDPHVGTKFGGDVGKVETSVKGVHFADTLPRTAERMHLATCIRSVTSKEGDHQRAIYNVKTGYRPDPTLVHPSIGSILCYEHLQDHDLPRHISIAPQNFPARGGYLGARFDAFQIDDPKNPVPDLKAHVDQERLENRIDKLRWLEQQFRKGRLQDLEQNRTLHELSTDAALKMMSSDQIAAFDVSQESASIRESFGDSAFGRGCLAATRLIQAGVRCVEVTLSGWDSHINNHSLQSGQCEILDPALSSLLDRLEQQELLDSTIVVCGGEFGRTPQINPAEGRDHWPHGFSVFLAGGGIRKGCVYGATSPTPKLDADDPLQDIQDPVSVADLHATILRALGVPFDKELPTPIGRPIKYSEGNPIDEILDIA